MEREIVTAGRKLSDYIKAEGIAKIGRKELHLLASVATDLLPGDGYEMVRKMMSLGARSGVYESIVLSDEPMNLRVASALDRLINREMIAEGFAKRVIALLLVVIHPSDDEVGKIEKFVDGVPPQPNQQPTTPIPTPQPQPIIPQPTPRPITPQPTPTPQPTIPQRVRNIPTPPVQPTIVQRIQNTPTPRPIQKNNNVTVTTNTTVNNNTRIVTTNNGVVSITGGGGNITINGVTVSGGGGNISVNTSNNNTTVTVGSNITVTGNGGNVTVTSGGPSTTGALYDIRGGVLVKYNGTEAFPTIPKGVTSIGPYAFASNNYIGRIKIPEGVREIGEYAFARCPKLSVVTLPGTLNVVREYAFANCHALKGSIYVGDRLPTICSYAYVGCRALEKVVITDGAQRIYPYAFSGCRGIKTIDIKSSTVTIDAYAFHMCTSATATILVSKGARLEPMWDNRISGVVYL